MVEPETAIRFFCTVVPSVAPPFCAASAASTIASYVSAGYVKSVTLALKDLTFFWNSSVGWAPGMVPVEPLSRPASKSAEWSTVLPSVMYSLWVSRPWAASSLTSGTVWSKAMTSVASGLVALMAVTIDEKFVSVGSNVSFSP